MDSQGSVGVVVIGRNEGERLLRCLHSIPGTVESSVYVDSGSTDGSRKAARATGTKVIALDLSRPFTAARARNVGLDALLQSRPPVDYVQFVDGDCEFRAGWFDVATAHLAQNPQTAVVCGRRRERSPEASVYNQLCDWEWDTPIGQALACGGDAMMRLSALQDVGGYDPALIAGEEPELCVRLRAKGWEVWRLDAEMTWHDAQMTKFKQWWQRCRRAGFAFAQGAFLHGAPPERHFVTETRRALLWGAALPLAVLVLSLSNSTFAWLLFLYPLQVARLARRGGLTSRSSWTRAGYNTLGKFAEALGIAEFHINRFLGRRKGLIEYK